MVVCDNKEDALCRSKVGVGSEPGGRVLTVVDSVAKDFQYKEKTEGESTTALEER